MVDLSDQLSHAPRQLRLDPPIPYHLFSTIISPHQCHHHHSFTPSILFQPQNFFFLKSYLL